MDARDERRHPPGPEPLWNESWYFDWHTTSGDLGGYVRLGLYPNLGVSWYWACVVGEDRPLVTVIEHGAPLPSPPGSLELRGDLLWADHNVEEPLERWSLGLEARAVALDDPADAYGEGRGALTPFAFELDWETDGEPFRYPQPLDRYEVPCRVHGRIEVGDERIEVDAVGQRDHSWGVRDWWAFAWLWSAWRMEDGTRWHAVTTLPVTLFGVGYRQGGPAGAGVEPVTGVEVDPPTAHEVPVETAMPGPFHVIAGTGAVDPDRGPERTDRFLVEPRWWSPVLLEDPDGRISHFPRAISRFTAVDGSTGTGWIELNRPSPG